MISAPLFLTGGYTLRRKLLVDLFVQVGFAPLETFNPPNGRGTFNIADDWFVTVGASVFTGSLWGKGKQSWFGVDVWF